MTTNIPPLTTSERTTPHPLIGYTPVYAPSPDLPPHPDVSSPSLPRASLGAHVNGVCICVVVMVVGGWLGWSISDAYLGGVNIRAEQAAREQAEYALAAEQQRTSEARAALGCVLP